MPNSLNRPKPARDCPECQAFEGMKLQNVARSAPTNIPLLYICARCGTTLTIPPPAVPEL